METLTDYKKKVNFTDANEERFTIDIELTHRNGFKELSICGNYRHGGGQCHDSIKPANEAQKNLLEMWSKYHLNGMSSGTPEQDSFLEKKGLKGNGNYDYQKCVDALKQAKLYKVKHPETDVPFMYGHAWYHLPLPDDIEAQLDNIIAGIIKSGGNPTDLSFGDQQAQDFLDKTGTKFEVKFVEHGKHFDDDKDSRDIYLITLSRGERSFSFRFGQSINCSGRFWKYGNYKRGVSLGRYSNKLKRFVKPFAPIGGMREWDVNKNFAEPTSYDVLAGLQKYEVGTLDDFCSEFGYDSDSRKAEKTYHAVVNEYNNLKMLYSDSELEEMAEIQ